MSDSQSQQIEALHQVIAAVEAQRRALGDALVSAALVPLQEKLAELQAQQAPAVVERQRKQVTVLFMDIADSTQLVTGMDPEEAMDVFDSALEQLGRVVEERGGHVTRYMGDGLLAVFGAPLAREDDPVRAVQAGLELVAEAAQVGEKLGIPGLAARVGVNTGLVAVGGQTEAEDTLMGSAVNLAARLESAAPVGGVLISHETYRHIRGVFDIQEVDQVTAKGFAEPVHAYRVLRAKARAFHQPLRGVEGLETRMVGREAELKCLQEALLNALETGEGQVITVSGEAGVGKSRLLEEFQSWLELRPETMVFYQGRGRIEAQGLPYGLLRDVFADRFEILEDDSPQTVREKLVLGLQQGWHEQAEMKAHILGQLLGYDFRDSPHLQGVSDGEQLSNRALMYLGEYFDEVSRRRPLVMLLEDIHWADDSTLDAVNWLAERMAKLRMLIVCAGREALYERRPYWGEGEERHTRLALTPLTRRESRELVDDILRHVTHLPEDLRELIIENAEGNPFYLEELIKMLIEDEVIVTGAAEWRVAPERLQGTPVPSTLTGVLQARLDGLPPEERRVLQEASVVGRQFWDRVVAYVHAGGQLTQIPGLLEERLSNLRGRELIFRRETSAFAEAREYLFKHDLLREVTYESVLRKVRQAHHGLVADWLMANAGGRIGEYAGLIGEHLVLGGRGKEAVSYLLQAGEAALMAHSSREAERFYRRALELDLTDRQAAAARQGLGQALRYQGRREESIAMLRQGIELSRKVGDTDRLAHLVSQLAWVQWRARIQDSSEGWPLCRDAAKELEAAPDSPGLARLLQETARAAHFAHQPREVVAAYGRRATEMAQRLGLLDAQISAGITLCLANPDMDECARIYEQAAHQAEANGLLEIAARAYFNLGTVRAVKGDSAAAMEARRKSLELDFRTGDVLSLLFCLTGLADAYMSAGKLLQVPALVAEALDRISVPEQRARECQQEIAELLLNYEGEYAQALRLRRPRLAEARRRGDLPLIIDHCGWIASYCLNQAYLVEPGCPVPREDLEEAEAALREIGEVLRQNPSLGVGMYICFGLAQVKIAQRQPDQARSLLAEGEQLLDKGEHPPYQHQDGLDSRDEARFQLARVEGRWDEAVAVAQAFVERHGRTGASWSQARWLLALGDTFVGRGMPGDQELARQTYRQALARFTEMGAGGYAEAMRRRLESLPATP